MIYWYKNKDKYLFSFCDGYGFCKSSEGEALSNTEELYFLTKLPKGKSKKSFAATCIQDLMIDEENLDLLKIKETDCLELCPEIINLMEKGRVKAVNTNYDGFEGLFFMDEKRKKRVNILALGDVGSTLLMGLKLLGHSCIESIGIYDRSIEKLSRWEYEMNQTSLPLEFDALPEVRIIGRDELFNCEMFVFCASKGVPPVGSDVRDVRMVQYDENRKLIRDYAVMAGDKKFKGIFAVVSDPVDLLCKAVLDESSGNLSPEQIKGYGLGVMNARAAYYAKKQTKFTEWHKKSVPFGSPGAKQFQ
jgi:hypothetical protein